MNKDKIKKVKKFVKDNSLELVVSGIVSASFVVGFALGGRHSTKELCKCEWFQMYLESIRDLQGCSAIAATGFGQDYKIEELGRLGKDIVESGFDANNVTNYVLISKE